MDIFLKMSVYFIYILVKRAGPFMIEILLGSWENRSRATYNHTSWRDWLATHEQKAFGFKGTFPSSPNYLILHSLFDGTFSFFKKKMVPDLGVIVKDQAHYKW